MKRLLVGLLSVLLSHLQNVKQRELNMSTMSCFEIVFEKDFSAVSDDKL